MVGKERVKRIILYMALLLSLVLLAFVLSKSAVNHYHSFKDQQREIKNANFTQIESWMTPRTIIRRFNLSESDLVNELKTNSNKTNFRVPLDSICKKNKLNCSLVVEELNKKIV